MSGNSAMDRKQLTQTLVNRHDTQLLSILKDALQFSC